MFDLEPIKDRHARAWPVTEIWIHGQPRAKTDWERAALDAHADRDALIAEVDLLRAEIARLESAVIRLTHERDEARGPAWPLE